MFLKYVMRGISNIIFNAKQGDMVTKEMIIDSLERMLQEYKDGGGEL